MRNLTANQICNNFTTNQIGSSVNIVTTTEFSDDTDGDSEEESENDCDSRSASIDGKYYHGDGKYYHGDGKYCHGDGTFYFACVAVCMMYIIVMKGWMKSQLVCTKLSNV